MKVLEGRLIVYSSSTERVGKTWETEAIKEAWLLFVIIIILIKEGVQRSVFQKQII